MNQPVRLYMRVESQDEICIGTARSMPDVPRLLEEIAALFRGRIAAEAAFSQSLAAHSWTPRVVRGSVPAPPA